MTTQQAVSLIIITHGGGPMVENLLTSIAIHTEMAHEIVVFDNNSPDDTADRVQRHSSNPRLIRSARNLGYGAGINSAVRIASSDDIVIMNSDLRVTPGWLPPLVAALNENHVAIASPIYCDAEENPQETGAVITAEGHVHKHVVPVIGLKPVDHISAACWAFKKSWFESIGGFNPAFGLGYYEDVDVASLCSHYKRSVVVVDSSRVIHEENGSFETTQIRHLSHRNHARNAARWQWLYKGNFSRHTHTNAAISNGQVAIVGHYPDLTRELQAKYLSVTQLASIEELETRGHRDDVIVVDGDHELVESKAPRAEVTSPHDIYKALKRAGICLNSIPPRPLFSSISNVRSQRW